jgi:hypothetical protein
MDAVAGTVPFRATHWLFPLSTTARLGWALDGGNHAKFKLSGVQSSHGMRCQNDGRRVSRESGFAPHLMTPDERLSELGRILASGVLRMREQSSSISAASGDSALAISVAKSVSRPRAEARNGGR